MQLNKVTLEYMSAGEIVDYIATLDEIPQNLAQELAERYTRLYQSNAIHDKESENRDEVRDREEEIEHLRETIEHAINILEGY